MQGDQKNKEMVLGDKEEYGAIDFFRLICAILVIAIHIPPFLSFNIKFSFGFSQVICRVAVPFFFLTSGYFVQKKIGDSEQILKYMERLLKMYIIYTVLYLPQIVYRYIESETSFSHAVLSFIRNFLLIGSYTHLWYFVGLLIAVFLLEILVCKLRFEDKKLFWVAIIVYMLGVLGNAYKNIFLNIPILDLVFKVYYKIFVTTRNGVFLGFPFVSLGYLIKKMPIK